MFIYFVQKKRWLDDNPLFLKYFWTTYKSLKRVNEIKDEFYHKWLCILFFEAFNKKFFPKQYFPKEINSALALAPYLNGGLFKPNPLDEIGYKIEDDIFEKIFDFFEKYNFTIREELPLEQEVAVDPEMIGKVYESLVNVSEEADERGEAGIFYTARVEIDLMVRRSLIEYFANNLRNGDTRAGLIIPKEMIYRLVFAHTEKDIQGAEKEIAALKKDDPKEIWLKLEELLDNVTVIDPACGSGSFLVGMLNVLAALYKIVYRNLDKEYSDFNVKKEIIGRSLYGVDVMDWAVHVAELRLWLQLIVESDLKKEEMMVEPLLPNLTFKLRTGDSLVEEIAGINLSIRKDNRFISSNIKRKLTELKNEKLKFYYNDRHCKFKNEKEIAVEELRIFRELLSDRITILQNEIRNKSKALIELTPEQEELYYQFKKPSQEKLFKNDKGRLKAEIEELESTLQTTIVTKNSLKDIQSVPFVWDIDFAEIFAEEKGGFDILIGNPPYVRQELIAPPLLHKEKITNELKREYKEKLLKSIQAHFPQITKLDKKSDLYVYFYFHGLALLNKRGTFCFITSNSWLDVGFGKDLQEFLLRYVPIKAIYDNSAKRSFTQADINTIIALLGAPGMNAFSNSAKFVAFRKPFEDVVSATNLIQIDKAALQLKYSASRNVITTDAYRLFILKQEDLLREGWEYPEDEEESETDILSTQDDQILNVIVREKAEVERIRKRDLLKDLSAGKYVGNKWGGKYLRAPDIFFTILEKGKGKLVRLGDVAEVRFGIKTGANEFFYLDEAKIKEWEIEEEFLKPVIKSPRECKSILINPDDLKYKIFMCHKRKSELRDTKAINYIKWGEKCGFHNNPSCKTRDKWYEINKPKFSDYLWMMTYRERFFVLTNNNVFADARFYDIYINSSENKFSLGLLLNSTLTLFYIELMSRTYGGGGGPVDVKVYEVEDLMIIKPELFNKDKKLDNFFKREIVTIFDELGFNSSLPISKQVPDPLPDRKEIDDIVFDILGLTQDERREVYLAVCELVKTRIEKARSLKQKY